MDEAKIRRWDEKISFSKQIKEALPLYFSYLGDFAWFSFSKIMLHIFLEKSVWIEHTNIRLESCCLQNYVNVIIYCGSSPLLLLFCAEILKKHPSCWDSGSSTFMSLFTSVHIRLNSIPCFLSFSTSIKSCFRGIPQESPPRCRVPTAKATATQDSNHNA